MFNKISVNSKTFCEYLFEGPRDAEVKLDDSLKDKTWAMDNASSHAAKETKQYCKDHNIKVEYQPPNSPATMPVERAILKLRRLIGKELKYLNMKTCTIPYYMKVVYDCWQKIDQKYLQKTIDKIPRVYQELLEFNGEYGPIQLGVKKCKKKELPTVIQPHVMDRDGGASNRRRQDYIKLKEIRDTGVLMGKSREVPKSQKVSTHIL